MRWRARLWLLGGRFEFESDSPALLRLVKLAYGGLPSQRFSAHSAPFRIRLRLSEARTSRSRASQSGRSARVPALRTLSGPGGLLCASMDTHNFAVLSPRERAGLIVASVDNLPQPYHVRYELIEFSVFTLAARAQALVPLHGGCVGRKGRGVLLIGESGAGKSTLALQSVLRGLELLAEDAVFVQPERLLATGVANFLHVRRDGLRFIEDAAIARRIERSPIIRRRSGVRKFEVDLRRWGGAVSRTPMRIEGVVFLSPHPTASAGLVSAVGYRQMVQRLRAAQTYAATQPGWSRLMQQLAGVRAFEVRRGKHPADAAEAIAQLLR